VLHNCGKVPLLPCLVPVPSIDAQEAGTQEKSENAHPMSTRDANTAIVEERETREPYIADIIHKGINKLISESHAKCVVASAIRDFV